MYRFKRSDFLNVLKNFTTSLLIVIIVLSSFMWVISIPNDGESSKFVEPVRAEGITASEDTYIGTDFYTASSGDIEFDSSGNYVDSDQIRGAAPTDSFDHQELSSYCYKSSAGIYVVGHLTEELKK